MRIAIAIVICSACGRVGFEPTDGSLPSIDGPAAVVANFEAESGQLTPSFAIALDHAASGGSYLLDNASEGVAGDGHATYTFSVPTQNTYYVWSRTLAPRTSRDSFFISIDGVPDTEFEATDCSYVDAWRWAAMRVPFNCPDLGALFGTALAPGTHTLRFRSREGQSALDRIVVSNDPAFVPVD